MTATLTCALGRPLSFSAFHVSCFPTSLPSTSHAFPSLYSSLVLSTHWVSLFPVLRARAQSTISSYPLGFLCFRSLLGVTVNPYYRMGMKLLDFFFLRFGFISFFWPSFPLRQIEEQQLYVHCHLQLKMPKKFKLMKTRKGVRE